MADKRYEFGWLIAFSFNARLTTNLAGVNFFAFILNRSRKIAAPVIVRQR